MTSNWGFANHSRILADSGNYHGGLCHHVVLRDVVLWIIQEGSSGYFVHTIWYCTVTTTTKYLHIKGYLDIPRVSCPISVSNFFFSNNGSRDILHAELIWWMFDIPYLFTSEFLIILL